MFQQALDTISKQVLIRPSYDNFIGGKFVAPVEGRYFDNPSPVTGAKLCQIARSSAADIELALDAAHKAKDAWGKTPVAERSRICSTRSPTRWRPISSCWRSSRRSTTASRSARRPTPTCRCASTIGAITPASSARRKAASPRSTTTPSPITSMSRSASSARSFPWNFPLLMAVWKLAPRSPPAIASC